MPYNYTVSMSYTLYLYSLYVICSIPVQSIYHMLCTYTGYTSNRENKLWNSRDILPTLFIGCELVLE